MNKQITLAKTAGFCFGVNRAVKLVEGLLDEGKRVCTLGPIIHNPQMVEYLAGRGVVIADSVDDIPQGYTVVIRSHGVDRQTIEKIRGLNIEFCDATCPFVSKIHRIAEKNSTANEPVLIAGDRNHAEVIGIMGYAKAEKYCFQNVDELSQIVNRVIASPNLPVCVVSQTTFNSEIWEMCSDYLKENCKNAKIFATICDATGERQKEAVALAKCNDLMVIVGGRHSSNTKKLYELCLEYTKTVLIETAAELKCDDIKSSKLIGVTAGASTPAVIIKEVINTMTDIIENEGTAAEQTAENKAAIVEKSDEEMAFEEALEASLNNMDNNQKVRGLVVAVNPTEVQVDIGRKYTGIVPADELSNDSSKRPADLVKVGDEIDLIVMKTNDQEGIITLSKRRFDARAGLVKMEQALESQETLEGSVTAVVKGGITVISEGVRVFVPASHATLTRSEALEDLVGTTVPFRIIDIRRGRSVVGSVRSVLKEQKKAAQDELWSKIAVGDVYQGTVKSLTSYGAFVDIGGVDGMIHITELSWTRIKHPSEVVNVGDLVEVYVKDLDNEKRKISLGFKKAEDNPWEVLKTKYQVGDVATVTVVSFATYGAFANVIPGIDGLIHISKIANRHIEKPQDALKIGDTVDALITDINYDTKRVSLSIRDLLDADEPVDETVEQAVEAESTEEAAE